MSDAIAQIDALQRQAEDELRATGTADALEQFRIKYLGTKGSVKGLSKLIGAAPPAEKPAVGQRVNAAKDQLTAAFEARKAELSQGAAGAVGKDAVDVTEPGLRPQIGRRHILMQVVDELTELFGRMGFAVATGPEVEDEFHNFVALNIPESHPAR